MIFIYLFILVGFKRVTMLVVIPTLSLSLSLSLCPTRSIHRFILILFDGFLRIVLALVVFVLPIFLYSF